VVHGENEAAGEGVPVEQRERRHRERQHTRQQRVEARREEVGRLRHLGEVQAVGVEFGYRGCRDEHAGRVLLLDEVEREGEGGDEVVGESVVGGRGEGEQVDPWGREGADEGAGGADGYSEEFAHGGNTLSESPSLLLVCLFGESW